jgi:hypothetical protein
MEKSNHNFIIEAEDVWRSYRRGSETINACAGINLKVEDRKSVV